MNRNDPALVYSVTKKVPYSIQLLSMKIIQNVKKEIQKLPFHETFEISITQCELLMLELLPLDFSFYDIRTIPYRIWRHKVGTTL